MIKFDRHYSLKRLYEICSVVKKYDYVKALIVFGSLADYSRFDDYSDLDFIIVTSGKGKKELLSDISWLTDISPCDYYFFTSQDSLKVFYKDSVMCDFGILSEHEFDNFEHQGGRIIWSNDGFQDEIIQPNFNTEAGNIIQKDKVLGEIISNLYTGMSRFLRGEMLSAYKLVQCDNITLLIQLFLEEDSVKPSCQEYEYVRKIEFENATFSCDLSKVLTGYHHTPRAVLNTVGLLKNKYPQPIYKRIEELARMSVLKQ